MRRRGLVALLLVATAALAGCGAADGGPSDAAASVVETAAGPVRGVTHDGVQSWRGVPYAAPPVGDLRWSAPQPVEPWTDVLDGSDYGPVCLHGPTTNMSIALMEVGRSSEDCLTLNVHRPADADPDDPLPVMVWIHGGGFVFGSGSEAVYNSPELVRRGIVLVTLNYRLGRLGFLAHPELQDDASRVGNYGLLDQVAALEWVQQNIASFGGDPGNVTVFGESAGGMSVNALMTMPSADGLFERAISQSGFGREPGVPWEAATPRRHGSPSNRSQASDPSASELRALDAAQVMAVPPSTVPTGQIPFVDEVVPASVVDAFGAGTEADVPYLAGTTDLEVAADFDISDMTAARAARSLLVDQSRPVAVEAYGSEQELELHATSDALFTEPARHLAQEHAPEAPTYLYRFTVAPDTVLAAGGGAPHTAELAFVFDDVRRQGTPVANAEALADQVADLWVDFATDGEPDGWPRAETGEVMTFTLDGPVAGPDPWTARLDVVRTAYEQVLAAAGASV